MTKWWIICLLQIHLSLQWCFFTNFAELNEEILAIDFSPDGKFVATGSTSNRVTVFSTKTFDVLWYKVMPQDVTGVKFSPLTQRLGVVQDVIDDVEIFDIDANGVGTRYFYTSSPPVLNGTQYGFNDIDFNPTQTQITICGNREISYTMNISPGPSPTLTRACFNYDNDDQMVACKFNSNGDSACCTNDDEIYSCVNGVSNSTKLQIGSTSTRFFDIDFRPGSRKVLGLAGDNKIYEWDVSASCDPVGTQCPSNRITGAVATQLFTVSVAGDDKFFAAAGDNGFLYLFNMTDFSTMQTFWRYSTDFLSIRISDDGNYIVAGRADGVIDVYIRNCFGCKSSQYFDTTSETCLWCSATLNGCAACTNSTTCVMCYGGYYLDGLTCSLCRQPLDGCITCYNDSNCVLCSPEYFLNTSGLCEPCSVKVPGCEQCDNAGNCVKCNDDLYNISATQCGPCSDVINYCVLCSYQTIPPATLGDPNTFELYCRKCYRGYFPTATGQCDPCPSSCIACQSLTMCTACVSEMQLLANGTCASCGTYCVACSEADFCLQCLPGFISIAGVCEPCTHPCTTCVNTAAECKTCAMGFFFDGVDACDKCVGCSICNPYTGNCLVCPPGQYLPAGGTACAYCANVTSHCQLCQGSTCLYCTRNYELSGGSCIPLIPSLGVTNCMTFRVNSTTVCEHCSPGYYLDTGVCDLCPLECTTCESAVVCTECILGFYLDTDTCSPCVPPCVTCLSDTVCLSCGDSSFLNLTACSKCYAQIAGCASCLNSTMCTGCQPGFFLAADYLSCIECSANCSSCNSSTDCLSCIPAHYLNGLVCDPCPSNCAECNGAATCQACMPSYYLTGTDCEPCTDYDPHCKYCDSSACLVCQIYYFLQTGACQSCPGLVQNCVNCNGTSYCVDCSPGYYEDSGSCSACNQPLPFCDFCNSSTVCEICSSGYYVDSNSECSKCTEGCRLCSDDINCLTCDSNYLMNETSECEACHTRYPGCDVCNLGLCEGCQDGYYQFSVTECRLCDTVLAGCSICKADASECHECTAGYKLVGTDCQLCSLTTGCQLCNTTHCHACDTGFYLDSNRVCQACALGCLTCIQSQCKSCDSGYYLVTGACLLCSDFSEGCIFCDETDCHECKGGFFLNASTKCQPCNIDGCEVCNEAGQCITCNEHYYFSAGVCEKCEVSEPGCEQCTLPGVCTHCSSGYFLESNNCYLCETRFDSCDLCDPTTCFACEEGFYLDGTVCSLCTTNIIGCTFCKDASVCTACDSSYFLDGDICTPCHTINNCLLCDNSTVCLFCLTGYYLQDDACLVCSQTITGCFDCHNSTACISCQSNYRLKDDNLTCEMLKTAVPTEYDEIRLITEYVDGETLKHTLQTINSQFVKIEQEWQQVTELSIVTQYGEQVFLDIKYVEWGAGAYPTELIYYTNNPFGRLDDQQIMNMPFFKKPEKKRLLLSVNDLNSNVQYRLYESAIREIYPGLDTSGGDLALEYGLDNPEFYRSIVAKKQYNYFIFGYLVSLFMLISYLVKVLYTVPTTEDPGEIISHVLFVKVSAMVIYPTLGGYINYCKGFTLLDFPWANDVFSKAMTDPSDTAPYGFLMFYLNVNLASTYLLALIIFTILTAVLVGLRFYKTKQEKLDADFFQQEERLRTNRYFQLQELVYHIFIAGITFSSFCCFLGILYNPHDSITVGGFFYVAGLVIYASILYTAIRDFMKERTQCHKLRVVIKATMFTLMNWSPVPLFAGVAVIDIALMSYEYRIKLKTWVVPRCWLLNQILCLVACALLIFFNNMILGLIMASLTIIAVLVSDTYLHYREYKQFSGSNSSNSPKSGKLDHNFSIQNLDESKNEPKLALEEMSEDPEDKPYQKSQADKSSLSQAKLSHQSGASFASEIGHAE